MKKFLTVVLPIAIALIFSFNDAKASHLVGADIVYDCVGQDSFFVTVKVYRDCSGISQSTTSISVGVRSDTLGLTSLPFVTLPYTGHKEISGVCSAVANCTTCSPGCFPLPYPGFQTIQGVEEYIYQGLVILPAESTDWKISYSTCCRNGALTNINAGSFYIAAIVNNTNDKCNDSPRFQSIPVPYMCPNTDKVYNNKTYDPERNAIEYTREWPMSNNYRDTVLAWQPGHSTLQPIQTTPPMSLQFDSITGQYSFNALPNQVCALAMSVSQFDNSTLENLGSAMRDIQFVIVDQSHCPPANVCPQASNIFNFAGDGVLVNGNTVEVCPGNTISFCVEFTDSNLTDILYAMDNSQFVTPGATVNYTGTNPIKVDFSYTPAISDTGFIILNFCVSDSACDIPCTQFFPYVIRIAKESKIFSPATYCQAKGPVPLMATGGSEFTWFQYTPSTPAIHINYLDTVGRNVSVFPPPPGAWYIAESNLAFGTISSTCDNIDSIYIPSITPFIADMKPTEIGICVVGDQVQLNLAGVLDTSYTYIWDYHDTSTISDIYDPQPIVTPDTIPAFYTLTVVDSTDVECLIDTVIFEITLAPGPPSQISPQTNTEICIGESHPLLASGGVRYRWFGGNTISCSDCPNPVTTPNRTGSFNYNVRVYNSAGCFTELTTTLIVNDLPNMEINDGKEVVEIFRGDVVQLEAKPIGTNNYDLVVWTPNIYLTDDSIPNPIAEPEQTTTYIATAYDFGTGCIHQDTITIVYKGCDATAVPSAFSPNEDGLNDVLYANSRGFDDIENFSIFNRWGGKVFETNEIDQGWDGTINGEVASMGTYVYLLQGSCNGSPFNKKGSITLLR